jgi:hypothetical protein
MTIMMSLCIKNFNEKIRYDHACPINIVTAVVGGGASFSSTITGGAGFKTGVGAGVGGIGQKTKVFPSAVFTATAKSARGTIMSRKISMARQKWYRLRLPISPLLQSFGITPKLLPPYSSPIILCSERKVQR